MSLRVKDAAESLLTSIMDHVVCLHLIGLILKMETGGGGSPENNKLNVAADGGQ